MARGGCHVYQVIWSMVRNTRLVDSDGESRMVKSAKGWVGGWLVVYKSVNWGKERIIFGLGKTLM